MNGFDRKIRALLPDGLMNEDISVLQINLGRYCNLSCDHCHLACSPSRVESMPESVMAEIVSALAGETFEVIDITGGSPELHPNFAPFLQSLRKHGRIVRVRTNLVNLAEPSLADLVPLFKELRVSLVGSLPCYTEENVDNQRGEGVYARSIAAIRTLNRAGYGRENRLPLYLAYNPGGFFLPPPQLELEEAYREELAKRGGVQFTRLLVLTNMPIGRYRQQLQNSGETESYQKILEEAFNPLTLPHLMCRHQICIDWDGCYYDCDFNLALGITVNHGRPHRIQGTDVRSLTRRSIVTGTHCFGCAAGPGSSCSGSLALPKDCS